MGVLGDLTKLPGSHQTHRWADWAELLCLYSPEGELTLSELAEAAEQRLDWLNSEGLDEAEPDSRDEDELTGETVAETNDKLVAKAREVFESLAERESAYGVTYPFELNSDSDTLMLRDESTARDLYVFLAICSGLRYVPSGADRTSLTSRYEAACLIAIRSQLGKRAEVHLFGKNAELLEGRYTGRLNGKITKLAADLNEKIRFDPDDFGPKDFGDNGLDIVAWIPTGDNLNGKVVVFGQCACTPEWVTKQHSSSDDAWYEVITLQSRPVNMCFIPYDFRRADGRWFKAASIKRTSIVDRRRLFHYLDLSNETEADLVLEKLRAALDLDTMRAERSAGLSDL